MSHFIFHLFYILFILNENFSFSINVTLILIIVNVRNNVLINYICIGLC